MVWEHDAAAWNPASNQDYDALQTQTVTDYLKSKQLLLCSIEKQYINTLDEVEWVHWFRD